MTTYILIFVAPHCSCGLRGPRNAARYSAKSALHDSVLSLSATPVFVTN